MLDPFKDKEMEKRNKNVGKPSLKNPTDRNLIATLVTVGIALLIVAGIIITLIIVYM